MTAGVVKGMGFRGALRYNLAKIEQGQATLLESSFVRMNEHDVMREIAMVRMLRPNLQKYFYHTSLNFPPEENFPDQMMVKIAHDYMESMGFGQNQYAIFRHYDVGHPHIHLMINRIGYDGSVVSDGNDFRRTEDILRRLEKKYRLRPVINSREAPERAATKNELELVRRKNKPSSKQKLQILIKAITKGRPTTEEFIKLLEKQGVNILFNQASTGFVSGISFGYEGLIFKGASLGQAYKWQAIQNSISYEPERDREAISEGNIRTRNAKLARAGEADIAGTNTSGDIRVGKDNHITEGSADDASQNAGRVRQGDTAHQAGQPGSGGDRHADNWDQGDAKRGTTDNQGDQRSEPVREPLAHPALPHLDFVERLIGPDNTADYLDEKALNEFEKKQKKKVRKRQSPT